MESTISSLIDAVDRGDGSATQALFDALYSQLHGVAKRELARHGAAMTLSATILLHEAYLVMAGNDGPSFPDRARFLGHAARVMPGLIVDHARRRQAQKWGGRFEITSLATDAGEYVADHRDLERISEVLDELAKAEPTLAEMVDLKFFCGISLSEIAALRGLSERTIQRNWKKAPIYLHRGIRADLSCRGDHVHLKP